MSDLGALEELVLLAVGILGEDAYGYSVLQEIQDQTGRSVTLGAVHKSLYRLEERGLLRSGMGGATSERGGRRKRIFSLTGTGLSELRSVRDARMRMWSLVPSLNPEAS